MMRHKPTKIRHYDAIIAEQEYLNMSFQLNHDCKITTFFQNKQIKKLNFSFISIFCFTFAAEFLKINCL